MFYSRLAIIANFCINSLYFLFHIGSINTIGCLNIKHITVKLGCLRQLAYFFALSIPIYEQKE